MAEKVTSTRSTSKQSNLATTAAGHHLGQDRVTTGPIAAAPATLNMVAGYSASHETMHFLGLPEARLDEGSLASFVDIEIGRTSVP